MTEIAAINAKMDAQKEAINAQIEAFNAQKEAINAKIDAKMDAQKEAIDEKFALLMSKLDDQPKKKALEDNELLEF